uniref:Coiled-coil-helix-coiled-coil-helix domain containing 3b n=1 Tax=Oryzias latipes TaxID=8090 RepID=A0A3P9L193_ORYLA
MGGNSPSHLPEENRGRGVTFVKGIRLSDNVINRMKLSPKVSTPLILSEPQTPATTPGPASPVQSLSPPLPQEASPPSQPPLTKLAPPPVKFHSLPPSSVEPVESTSPAEAQTCPFVSSAQSKTPAVPEYPVSVVESVTPTHSKLEAQTPAPAFEQTAELLKRSPGEETPPAFEPSSQTPAVTIQPPAAAEPLESAAPSPAEPASLSPTLESAQVECLLPSAPSEAAETTPCAAHPAVVTDVPSVLEPPAGPASQPPASLEETSPPCHDEPSTVPTEESFGKFTASPLPDPTLPAGESTMSTSGPPQDEDEEPVCPVSPPTAALPISPEEVEDLRRRIKAEMEKDLQQEMNQRRQELERQLEEMRTRAEAEAKAASRARVEEQVKKTLEEEKAAYVEKLTESIAKERIKSEDEKLAAQLYWMELKARQLEEKEEELKKREELRKKQVAKLEAKCAQFYRVSAESFQKGKEETESRFLRFNIRPVCGDLQSQILKCYKENAGRTLMCSSIASAYMQCVNKAKKDKLVPGG